MHESIYKAVFVHIKFTLTIHFKHSSIFKLKKKRHLKQIIRLFKTEFKNYVNVEYIN